MDKKTTLQKVSEAACRFIYTSYEADEIANGKDMVMYCIGDKMLFSIYIREESFDFMLLIGRDERQKFEAVRSKLPQNILELYDRMVAKDETWLWVPVADMDTLEAVKQLIVAKHEPNRKPFSKDIAVYSKCGMRCDLCVYYLNGVHGKDSPMMVEIQKILTNYWDEDFTWSCPGCFAKDSDNCDKLDCAKEKDYAHCLECEEYPCGQCGSMNLTLQADVSRTAETLSWAIMPYIGGLM